MTNILRLFQSRIPYEYNSQGEKLFDKQHLIGDQLTIDRAVNAIKAVSNGYTEEARLEGLIPGIADWHTGMKILEKECKSWVKKAYRPNKDFIITEIKARVVAAALKKFGMEKVNCQPKSPAIPSDLSSKPAFDQMRFLHKVSAMIVDEFVLEKAAVNGLIDSVITAQEQQDLIDAQNVNDDGRYPCRFKGCNKSYKQDGKRRRDHELTHNPPPYAPEVKLTKQQPDKVISKNNKDDMYSYNTALMNEGLFFMNFLDAVSEGDGDRIVRQYKYLMLLCKADGQGSKNYALECLYLLFQVNALLSPRDAHRLIWNRGVNNHGVLGANNALDLEVEMSNLHLKQAIKNLGVKVTEKAVSRICKSEQSCRKLLYNVDKEIRKKSRGTYHSHSSTKDDIYEIVHKLMEKDALTPCENRQYRSFPEFDRDPTSRLDSSKLFKWVNKHKKNIDLGTKAR